MQLFLLDAAPDICAAYLQFKMMVNLLKHTSELGNESHAYHL